MIYGVQRLIIPFLIGVKILLDKCTHRDTHTKLAIFNSLLQTQQKLVKGLHNIFSTLQSRDLVARGMRRHFGTPLKMQKQNSQQFYRNKILDVVDIGEMVLSPIEFHTPKRVGQVSTTSSSLASASISPVTNIMSSDEEVITIV